jgi:hypothetical protein
LEFQSLPQFIFLHGKDDWKDTVVLGVTQSTTCTIRSVPVGSLAHVENGVLEFLTILLEREIEMQLFVFGSTKRDFPLPLHDASFVPLGKVLADDPVDSARWARMTFLSNYRPREEIALSQAGGCCSMYTVQRLSGTTSFCFAEVQIKGFLHRVGWLQI